MHGPRMRAGLTPDGQTLGTPIAVLVRNKDQRSGDYSEMSVRGAFAGACSAARSRSRGGRRREPESSRGAQVAYRPSHADATYDMKYGVRAIAVRPSCSALASGAAGKP